MTGNDSSGTLYAAVHFIGLNERHSGRGLLIASGGQAQHGAKVVRQFLKAAGFEPALGLLVGGPRRQIVGHPAPGGVGLDDVAQAVNTSRKECSRWPASSGRSVRQGATSAHSSSETSEGQGLRVDVILPERL